MAKLSSELETMSLVHLERVTARLTSSRRTILALLESANKPITITEISDRSPALAQSSIYRNLSVMEEAGLVHRIVGDHDFAFFELTEDVLGHHHHLRCTVCGDVVDIELPKNMESTLTSLATSIGKKHNYINVHHHMEFTGICNRCR